MQSVPCIAQGEAEMTAMLSLAVTGWSFPALFLEPLGTAVFAGGCLNGSGHQTWAVEVEPAACPSCYWVIAVDKEKWLGRTVQEA